MARLTFVVGKGGVGKTTVACALVLHLAAERRREKVLLMSTDPAHSLREMLEEQPLVLRNEHLGVGTQQSALSIQPRRGKGLTKQTKNAIVGGPDGKVQARRGHAHLRSGEMTNAGPERLRGTKGQLWVWEVDSQKEFQKFLAGNRDSILEIVEQGTFFSKEEIAPLLDTTLPGMAEVAGLLAIEELVASEEYDHIVVDTAPFGHTLRLFELPGHFQKFLNFLEVASRRDALLAERFGGRVRSEGNPFVERWRKTVERLREAFSAEQAEIVLVTSPEMFSLNEAERSMRALEESQVGMRLGRIVLNRVVTEADGCVRCKHRKKMAEQARRWLRQHFPRTPLLLGPDPGNPILGVEQLRRFGEGVFGRAIGNWQLATGKTQKRKGAGKIEAGGLKLRKAEWPVSDFPLSFTVGKGGVGKTTITAALGFVTREHGNKEDKVTVCSTDPAPSLDDVFQKAIGDKRVSVLDDRNFGAMELDSMAEFRKWAGEMRERLDAEMSTQSGGVHVDLTFEKEVFAALLDVAPPGVDEVFAIFRIMELIDQQSALSIPREQSALSGQHSAKSASPKKSRVVAGKPKPKLEAKVESQTRVFFTPTREARAGHLGPALKREKKPQTDELQSIGIPHPAKCGGLRDFRNRRRVRDFRNRVLIDMAPTGHALELLRTPERMLKWSRLLLKSLAAHRRLAIAQEVGVELASLGQRVRQLMEMMKDARWSRAYAVMLPEPVPDRQTRRLLDALEEIGIAVDAIFVNRVLRETGDCERCARSRAWQLESLKIFRKRYPKQRAYVVREFPQEIAGATALKRFTGQLWEIAR